MNSVVEYTGEDFEKDTLTEGITLVDFGAAWCGPCQMLEPTLVELSKQVDYKIVKVDTDQYSELTQKYKVKSLPTMIIFKDRIPVENLRGFMTHDEIDKKVKEFM